MYNNRKQRQFQLREAEIIDAAMSLFRHHELSRVTIEQIAERAEIGKGTVYKHFCSKDEIYARILLDLNQAMRTEIAGINTQLPFRHRLDRIIEIIWTHDMRDSKFLRRLNQHLMSGDFRKNLSSSMLQEFNQLQEDDNQFYLTLLAQAQQKGEVVAGALEHLLFCATSAIDGAILCFWQMENAGQVSQSDHGVHLKALQDFVYRALALK